MRNRSLWGSRSHERSEIKVLECEREGATVRVASESNPERERKSAGTMGEGRERIYPVHRDNILGRERMCW